MTVDSPPADSTALLSVVRGAALSVQERPGSGGAWSRRLPVGAEPVMHGGVHFRVWAPGRQRVEIVFEDRLDRGVSRC